MRHRSRHASDTSSFDQEDMVNSAADMVACEVDARRAASFRQDDSATTRLGGGEPSGGGETHPSDVSVLAAAGVPATAPPTAPLRPQLRRGLTTSIHVNVSGGSSDSFGQRQSTAGGSSFGERNSAVSRSSAVSRNSAAGIGSSSAVHEPCSNRMSFTQTTDRKLRAARNREMELMTREWLERARMSLEDAEHQQRDART